MKRGRWWANFGDVMCGEIRISRISGRACDASGKYEGAGFLVGNLLLLALGEINVSGALFALMLEITTVCYNFY